VPKHSTPAKRRVQKSNGKLYWYGSGGDILAETDASGNTLNEYIIFGGKRIAMLPAGGNPSYYVEDMLGTSRVMTTNTGVVCYDADFYPYGGERAYTNTCPQNYKFEGKERDAETGNDDFGARYFNSNTARGLVKSCGERLRGCDTQQARRERDCRGRKDSTVPGVREMPPNWQFKLVMRTELRPSNWKIVRRNQFALLGRMSRVYKGPSGK